MIDYKQQRQAMVDGQLRPNRVVNPDVLAAFEGTPRELFVPDALKGVAYSDEDLAVNDNRSLMEPLVLGRLVQAAGDLTGADCLIVGAGSGYSAAVVATIASSVVAIDTFAQFDEVTGQNLASAGFESVILRTVADNQAGATDLAPFDFILIDGGVRAAPQSLLDQLSPTGCLMAVERGNDGVSHAVAYRAAPGGLARTELFEAAVPMLAAFEAPARPEFKF